MGLPIGIVIACLFVKGILGATASTRPSVVIIGAGPAGIAAATRLLKNNITDINILEAESRVGGRIHSVKFGDVYVDLGAQFCHGEENNVVYDMVKDLNVLRHSLVANNTLHFYNSNGNEIAPETVNKIVNLAESLRHIDVNTTDGCKEVESVGDCLDIKSKLLVQSSQDSKERQIFAETHDWINSHLCIFDSTFDLHDLRTPVEYKTCGGDLEMNWNGHGFKTILEVMLQTFPDNKNQSPIDNKIHLGKEVSNITNWQNGDKVRVTTLDGTTFEADHVIFTPSVGVLKDKHNMLFDPSLQDEKVGAIENIGFGAISKVIMHFSEKWWTGDGFFSFLYTPEDRADLKEKKLDWLIDLSSFAQADRNPNVLYAWCAGSHVPEIENLSDEKILEGIEYVINKFLSPHYNVSMPDKIIRTFWYKNPNFRGTYSFESVKGYSSGGSHLPKKLGAPLLNTKGKPTVLFAGEATHPHYFSTVHGAIETGYREADRLIKLYS